MDEPTPTPAPAVVPAIQVNADPTQAQYAAAVRQAVLVASGVLSAFGATHLSTEIGALAMVAGPLAGLIVFVMGQLHTRHAEQKQIVMANALPDAVAKVVQ